MFNRLMITAATAALNPNPTNRSRGATSVAPYSSCLAAQPSRNYRNTSTGRRIGAYSQNTHGPKRKDRRFSSDKE